MKKKIYFLLTLAILSFTFASCGISSNSGDDNSDNGDPTLQLIDFSNTHNISTDRNYVSGGTSTQPLPETDAAGAWNVVSSNSAILDVTIDGNQLVYTPKARGEVIITITKGQETWYFSISIPKNLQTIHSNKSSLAFIDDTTSTINISGGRGTGNWSVVSNDSTIATATITAGGLLTITAKAVGDTSITLSKLGDSNYFASNSITIAVHIRPDTTSDKLPQTLTATKTITLAYNSTGTTNISGGRGTGNWSVTSDDKNIATATITAGGLLTITAKAVGDTSITVRKLGDNDYFASNSITIAVHIRPATTGNKGTQTLTAPKKIALAYNSNSIITISGGKGTGNWSVTTGNTNIATATITAEGFLTITPKAVGDTTITIEKAGDSNYFASNSIAIAVKVQPVTRKIILSQTEVVFTYGDSAKEIIAFSDGIGDWGATSDNPNVATVKLIAAGRFSINPVGAGDASITISRKSAGNYKNARVPLSVTVNKGDQTLTATKTIALDYDSSSTINISGGKGSGEWSVTSDDKTVATATITTEGQLTITAKAVGDTSITIEKAGDSNYFASNSIAIAVKVQPVTRKIILSQTEVVFTYGDSTKEIIAFSDGIGDWGATSDNPNVATVKLIAAGRFSINPVGAGDASITISRKSAGNYKNARVPLSVTVNKGDQTLTATKTIALDYDSSSTINISGGKGSGEWSVTSDDKTVATATITTEGQLTITAKAVGDTSITIEKVGDNNYFSANPITISVHIRPATTLNKGAQTLTAPETIALAYDTTSTVTISGGKGSGEWSVTSDDKTIATATITTEGQLTITAKAVGDTSITIEKAGDDNYFASNPITIAVHIQSVTTSDKGIQTLIAPKTIALDYDSSSTITISGGKGSGEWSVTSDDKTIATATITTEGILTITAKGVGDASITITRKASGNYKDASVTLSVIVNKGAQILTAPKTIALNYDSSSTINISGGKGSGEWSVTSDDKTVATATITIEGQLTITAKAVGDTSITIEKAGDENYFASDPITIAVHIQSDTTSDKGTQTLTAPKTIALAYDSSSTITISGGKGSGEWSVTSDDKTIATATITTEGILTITAKAVGDASITITRKASGNYKDASITLSVIVNKGGQTLTAPKTISLDYDSSSTINISGGKGSGEWSVTSDDKTIATANITTEGQLTITAKAVGDTTMTIEKAGDENYFASDPISISVNVQSVTTSDKVTQTLIAPKTITLDYDTTSTVTISGGKGSGEWSVTSDDKTIAIATIDSNGFLTITAKAVGDASITITRKASGNYKDASVTLSVIVNKGGQTLIAPKTIALDYDSSSTINISGGKGSGEWSVTSDDKTIATATITTEGQLTITAKAVGDTTITIEKAGDDNYFASDPIAIIVKVQPVTRKITLSQNTVALTFEGVTKEITASSDGIGVWGATSDNPNVATVTMMVAGRFSINPVGVGDASITISRKASGNYKDASITLSVTVGKASQTLTEPETIALDYNTTSTVDISGGKGSGEWSVTSDDKNIATASIDINGLLTITAKSAGDTSITIEKAGNSNYFASDPISISVIVNKANQTLTAIKKITLDYDSSSTINVSGGKGSGEWSVTSDDKNIATATITTEGQLTITAKAVGDTTITIEKAGDSNYFAAKPISILVNIKRNQTLTAPKMIAMIYGITSTVDIIGGKGTGEWSVTSDNKDIATATIDSNGLLTITPKRGGDAIITISKAGDNNYFDSNSVNISVQIFYPIATASELQAIASDATSLSAYYIQTASIDISSITNFQPIGTSNSNSFRGIFKGNGFKIIGLKIDKPSDDNVGLFGFIRDAILENIRLENIRVQGYDNVGGLAGYSSGTIRNSFVSGTVRGDNDHIGGLVGYNSGTIQDSHSNGTRQGSGDVGGLVGYSDGTIQDSHANGTTQGGGGVGGLVGENKGTIRGSHANGTVQVTSSVAGGLAGYNGRSIIQDSYATSIVKGISRVGGLVGWNSFGTIQNNYVTGSVRGNNEVGGLIGRNVDGTIQNNYATGSVRGNSDVGGLIGWSYNGNYPNNYWNSETSGQTSSREGDSKTSSQMLAGISSDHFSGFGAEWNFGDSSSYPVIINNVADATNQQIHQAAGMVRLATVIGDNFFGGENFQQDIEVVIDSSFTPGTPFFVFDVNAEAPNNTGRVDFWDCVAGTGDTLLTTNSVGGTKVELRFAAGTSDKTAWQKASGNSCAVARSSIGNVRATDKLNLEAIISKGTGADKRSYSRNFSITIIKRNQNLMVSNDTVYSFAGDDATTISITGWGGTGNWSILNENIRVAITSIDNQGVLTITPSQTGITALQISKAGDENYFPSNSIKILILVKQDPSSPYPVATTSDLQIIGSHNNSLSAHYIQTANIDLSSITNFNPIGTNHNNSFRGSFNGNGFKITGLTINKNNDNIGLFGYLRDATLENIKLEEVRVRGNLYVGGLVGNNSGGTIRNSSVSGYVRSNGVVGGLVGGTTGAIQNSHFTGSVQGLNLNTGGLTGYNLGTITGSFATSSVRGNYFVGGLVGFNNGMLHNSFATGSVQGNNNVGGLIGVNYSSIQSSYSVNSVQGNINVRGLIGLNSGTVMSSYWNFETSGLTNSNGNNINRTSGQMLTGTSSDHFTGFDASWDVFGAAWDFVDSSSYPALAEIDATTQALYQAASLLRLANATGDNFLTSSNIQHNITINTNTVSNAGDTLFVFDTNLEATNDSNRVDFWDCASNSDTDIILTTQSVNKTNIELRFAAGTSDKTAWTKASGTSCAVNRSSSGVVQAGDKINLEAIVTKGTGTHKRTYTKKFSITFE